MSPDENIVQGTLKPDGTLELDQKPALAPGRVYVTLQPVVTGPPPKGGIADTIEEIRQYQQAHGYQGRTPEELARDEAERRADEAAYEQRMQEIWSQTRSGASSGGS
jgi:hypothetical protein